MFSRRQWRADYWKSNPRKYCEVCKCWFGDNQASVSFHEQGRRHKANVQRQLREARTKSSEEEKDKKKTEQLLASIEHAAISAYHKDLTTEYGDLPVQKAVKPIAAEDETERRVLNITSTILAEKQRELEKGSIKENIEKKVQQLKHESMSWQPLLSPEGYTYYYNAMTGVSQWEPPPGFAPVPQPQTYYMPTPTATSTMSTQQVSSSTNNYTESETTAQKRPAAEDASEEGPSSPKRSRPSGPYGGWQTVAEYEVEEPAEEKPGQETEAQEEKEPEVEFEEKTLPVPETVVKKEDSGYSGGFKTFSFKKSGTGRAQIRQRTSNLT